MSVKRNVGRPVKSQNLKPAPEPKPLSMMRLARKNLKLSRDQERNEIRSIEIQARIVEYIATHGPTPQYQLCRALRVDFCTFIRAIDRLEQAESIVRSKVGARTILSLLEV